MHAGERGTLALLGGVLVVDGLLIKYGKPSVTETCRKWWWLTAGVVGMFIAHLFDVLGPADPFRRFARLFG
jgi:hypothetical protein